MKYISKAALCLVTSLSTIMLSDYVQANEPADNYQNKVNETSSTTTIADIVVTANKRNQSLLDVGQTVSVLSADTLANNNVVSLEGIASAVPGLSFSKTLGDTPILTLRGVGFNEESLSAYPAVSAYTDEVPLPFPVMATHVLLDLERVEVLKGPQGTLFGQNSTGGAINFIAAKPTEEFGAGGSVSYARFNRVEANGYMTGALTSHLKARLAVQAVHGDDWQKSYTRDDTLGEEKYVVGRLLLDWTPSEKVHFLLNANGWVDKSDPQALQYIVNDVQSLPFAKHELVNYPFSPASPRAADWGPFEPFADKRMGQIALRSDFNFSGGITLTSLTSYAYYRQRAAQDRDGIALAALDQPLHNGHISTFGQELRLANESEASLRWVIGGNIEESKVTDLSRVAFDDISGSNPFSFFIYRNQIEGRNNNRNIAGFVNAELDVLPHLTVKAGARYTDSRQRFSFCNSDLGDGRVNLLYQALGGPNSPVLQPGDCVTLNDQGVPNVGPFQDTLKENNVSWRLGADYKLASGGLLYANISRGYKAGAYAVFSGITFEALAPLKQESMTAYEVGAKLRLFGGRGQLSASAFYYDYRDKQVRGFINDQLFGAVVSLVAVPKSRVIGADADLTVRMLDDLTLTGSVTFLDTKVQDYVGYDVVGQIRNFQGSDLPFTPRWSGSVSADYRPQLAGGGRPFIGATVNFRSTSESAFDGSGILATSVGTGEYAPGFERPFKMKGYALLDLRAGYGWDDGRYKISVFGQNVFNRYYTTNSLVVTDTISQYVGRPATYGVKFSFKY